MAYRRPRLPFRHAPKVRKNEGESSTPSRGVKPNQSVKSPVRARVR